jgi:hypothetical protein
LGKELTSIIAEELKHLGITSIRTFAEKVGQVYPRFVRGPETGEWLVEEYRPGRMVVRESSIISNAEFTRGVLAATFSVFGALNVRVILLDNRASGAEANRYLVEWLETDDD